MGIEYSLVKTGTGEAYELGKTAMRAPVAGWREKVRGVDPVRDHLAWTEVMQPSDRAVWRITSDDGNCAAAVLPDRWTRDELAGMIDTAFLDQPDADLSLKLADAILAWAGRDEVVVIPDTFEVEDLSDRLGKDIPGPHTTRTLWDDEATLR